MLVPIPEPSCDIFFSLRLNEAKDKAEELKAMIKRTRPDVKWFLSGDNRNGAVLAIIISNALADAKMAPRRTGRRRRATSRPSRRCSSS